MVSGSFHSPVRGPFHLSLTVLFSIGLSGVFSLTGWCRQIHAKFHRLRATQVLNYTSNHYMYGDFTLYVLPFQVIPLPFDMHHVKSYNPVLLSKTV